MKQLMVLMAVAFVTFMFTPCFGQNVRCDGALKGMKSVSFIVGDAPLSSNPDYLAALKAEVESKLKKAGITIIDLDTISKPKDKKKFFDTSGFLEINGYVNKCERTGEKPGEPFIIYSLQLVLRQRIELDRNDVKCLLPTWVEGSYNVMCLRSEAEDTIKKNVHALVDIFLAAYDAENS
jgi:hypothetical protein